MYDMHKGDFKFKYQSVWDIFFLWRDKIDPFSPKAQNFPEDMSIVFSEDKLHKFSFPETNSIQSCCVTKQIIYR